jgi:Trk K+ transport system NAD-binding subunit
MAVLKQAKVDKADVLIATTHEDNVNLMAAQVARKVFTVGLPDTRALLVSILAPSNGGGS